MAIHEAHERELALLRAQEASGGTAAQLSEDLKAACRQAGVSGAQEYVALVTADIEAITKFCEAATKNARSVARAAAPTA